LRSGRELVAAERRRREALEASAIVVPLTCKGKAFIRLTLGMWCIVSESDYHRVCDQVWYANKDARGKYRPARSLSPTIKVFMATLLYGPGRKDYRDGSLLNLTQSNVITPSSRAAIKE
jgi:hypothetical protein